MQANSSADANDRVHIVLKRSKPAKHNEEPAEPSADPNKENEAKNKEESSVEHEEPKEKPQAVRKVKEEIESNPHSSGNSLFDGDEGLQDDFTYDADSF